MGTIADLPKEPRYTIKTVCALTGIRAVTLRAWERRYGLLSPQRGDNQYRRYSEQEIAVLRWIKSRIDGGLSISIAVQEFKDRQQAGFWPDPLPERLPPNAHVSIQPPQKYAAELYRALTGHHEQAASELFREAESQLDLNTLYGKIIVPCLTRIGDAWERGEIRIATEHYSSAFLRGKLFAIFQAYPTHRSTPTIYCGCAPGEQHEIGALMFATMLRREGLRVEYLGPDIPLDDLIEYARYAQPGMICLSATIEENALRMRTLRAQLDRHSPSPLFGFGGAAFNRKPGLREAVPGTFLGENFADAVDTVLTLVKP